MASTRSAQPAASAQRPNSSRPARSPSVSAWRLQPPWGVAPISAISIRRDQSRVPLTRGASLFVIGPPRGGYYACNRTRDEERRAIVQDELPEHPESGSGICAVLVSFHPDPDLPGRVDRILAQVGALVIVDNGSGAEASADARRNWRAIRASRSCSNGANLGVARALNIGIERRARLGYGWVLLLDQDSVLDEAWSRS